MPLIRVHVFPSTAKGFPQTVGIPSMSCFGDSRKRLGYPPCVVEIAISALSHVSSETRETVYLVAIEF